MDESNRLTYDEILAILEKWRRTYRPTYKRLAELRTDYIVRFLNGERPDRGGTFDQWVRAIDALIQGGNMSAARTARSSSDSGSDK